MPRHTVDLRPFEWYIRSSFYLFLVMWPNMGLAFAANLQDWDPVQLGVVGLCGVIVCVLSVLVAHGAINRMRDAMLAGDGRGPSLLPVTRTAVCWLAAVVVNLAVIGWWGLANGIFPVLVLATFALAQVCVLIPVLSLRQCFLVSAGCIVGYVLLCLLGLPSRPLSSQVGLIAYGVVIGGFLAFTLWLTVWMLRVMWELEAARALAGQLAVAEERLRISRDLHDVFGRTLATISVKATLAGELARRARGEEAAAELDEIRRIADAAGRETRAVVRGERGVDLEAELLGARSVLESAGVRCDLNVDPAPVPPAVAEPLAWVTREAVTNILRHSRASWASIVLCADPPRLSISNDGPLEGTGGSGTGLDSMAGRLATVGGRLQHQRNPDLFTLTAEFGGPR